ncbi:nuclear transport factor 2 family protein [Streptomyces sp. MBT62]|uniref:nuclear transport factor 2 family protein n=1 Tax=Streptomyces sp. MBT62 TaxID=2800410 RepID=UPI00190B13C7|nr:nuclear transport factor 2 family protein [Streptomyces sp. MBT62]MBK3565209.1 nuclear transport factor 2 family protein [Streptomyces sp. MBT62]
MSAERIRLLEADRIRAMLTGDATTLRQLMSPDCSYVHSNGRTDTGEAYVDKVGRGVFRYVDGTVDEQSITVRRSTAVAVFRFSALLLIDAEEVVSVNRCAAVWAEQADRPQLIAFHSSSLPGEQP